MILIRKVSSTGCGIQGYSLGAFSFFCNRPIQYNPIIFVHIDNGTRVWSVSQYPHFLYYFFYTFAPIYICPPPIPYLQPAQYLHMNLFNFSTAADILILALS